MATMRAILASRSMAALAAAFLAGAVSCAQAAEGGFFSAPGKPAAPAIGGNATLADLEAAENALADLWTRLPFTARHVMFVSRKSEAYGGYDQRPSSVFAPGEPLVTYLEPIGYGWKSLGQDRYTFGITTDVEVRTTGGKIVGGQKGFQEMDLESHYRNREFFLTSTLTLNGIEPGDYIVAYTLHDHAGGRTTTVEQPFTIKAAN